MEDIETFMKELGNSFCFIGSEYKIKIGDRYNYIDLLLFNIKYNCYVVVELKVTEFKAEYVVQVQKYMNYIDKNLKEKFNNDTIGIIICKKENKFVIEYCSDERITVREYELINVQRWFIINYYNVGKMLSEAGKHYGEGIIKEYSRKLGNDLKHTVLDYFIKC